MTAIVEPTEIRSEAEADAHDPVRGVGDVFRRERLAQGLALEDVARQLKYAVRQLESFEEGRYASLPGAAVVRGMARSYARLLKLDVDPLLARIGREIDPPDADRLSLRFREPVPFSDRSKRSNATYIVLTLLVLLVAVGVALEWQYERSGAARMAFVPAAQAPANSAPAVVAKAGNLPGRTSVSETVAPGAAGTTATPSKAGAGPALGGSDPNPASKDSQRPAESAPAAVRREGGQSDAAATPSESGQASPAVAQPALPAGEQSAATSGASGTPAPAKHRLELRFAKESWVEVRDGAGDLLVSQLFRAGNVKSVDGLPPFALIVGNAEHVQLFYNDAAVDLKPHTKVAVARLTLP